MLQLQITRILVYLLTRLLKELQTTRILVNLLTRQLKKHTYEIRNIY